MTTRDELWAAVDRRKAEHAAGLLFTAPAWNDFDAASRAAERTHLMDPEMERNTSERAERSRPQEEQAKHLSIRLKEAENHVEAGRQLVSEWQPVIDSCRAGLEAMKPSAKTPALPRESF